MFDYAAGKLDWLAAGLPAEGRRPDLSRIGHLAVREVPTCGLSDDVETVRTGLRESAWDFCLVLNDEGIVLGRVGLADLAATRAATAAQAMKEGPSTFRPNVPVQEMLPYMERHHLETAVVTTSGGRFVGVLRRADAEQAVRELGSASYAAPDSEPYFAR